MTKWIIEFESNEDESDSGEKDQAELEIMIVDKLNRGNGYGVESIMLMMNYSFKYLNALKQFFVKIDDYNEPSICMFKKLGFVQYEYVKAFKQVSLKLEINEVTFPGKRISDNKYSFGKDTNLNIDLNY